MNFMLKIVHLIVFLLNINLYIILITFMRGKKKELNILRLFLIRNKGYMHYCKKLNKIILLIKMYL